MKISFFSFRAFEKPFYSFLDGEVYYFPETLSFENMKLAEGSEVICCFVNDKLNADVIKNLATKGLKLIALRCAGFNNVDMEAAKNCGISIVRVPAYSPNSVAEHAVALLMTLNRKTHKAYNRVREGNFSLDGLTGFDIHDKIVGVVGTGKIGLVFSTIMLGFGAKVFAYDPNPSIELKDAGVLYTSLDSIFSNSDIISLHLPLNPETKYIINQESVDKMKQGVYLINTSRGGLVNTASVIKGLKSGKIGALGLDVYEEEEGIFFIDHSSDLIADDELSRLMTFPNVLITSHQAFLTSNALTNIADTTMDSIGAFIEGKKLKFAL